MTESLEQNLTRKFYEWELWGRGWHLWEAPVQLEPPFYPFFGHFARREPTIDDGRKGTFLSDFSERLFPRKPVEVPQMTAPEREPFPFEAGDQPDLIEIQVAVPPDLKIAKDASAQLLWSLGNLSRPASFEIVGTKSSIVIQFACGTADRTQAIAQLKAFFPDAIVSEKRGYLEDVWSKGAYELVIDFGLATEFMRPIRSFDRFEPDPLAAVVGAMADLQGDDVSILQVLFIPTINAWPESILRAVTDGEGGHFFLDDKTMVPLAGQKISSPLFATVVRVAAASSAVGRAESTANNLARTLNQLSDPSSNQLVALSNEGYDTEDHSRDLIERCSRRCGMLLNSDELLSLVHLPSASVRSAALKREGHRTKTAPAISCGHRFKLGENVVGDKTVLVGQSAEQRSRHTYVIGASGTGKSTLLLNMIVQDIQNGEGLAVLDPHGDLVDRVIEYIPPERIEDVVLVDPSDEEYPVGFNILSSRSDSERHLLSSDLVSVFRRLSTSWGDQMTTVLGNAVLAFLESSEGGTLSDLRRFLVEPVFRNTFLQTVQDPEVRYYWSKEFPLVTGRPQGSILSRLDTFLRPKLIRQMVAQRENRLDFRAIMDGREILLAKLSQGLIGEENSYLLGTLIVSKLNQAASGRQDVQASERTPFYLYVDEFHNFITPSMASILSGARKYNLGLILAHQDLQQLWNRDSDVASAVISNPHTRICFRVGDIDAKRLENGFSYFSARDLQNLGVGEAVCRMERAEYDFNLATTPMSVPDLKLAEERRSAVIASSRSRNATARSEVEALLKRDLPIETEVEPQVKKRSPKIETSGKSSEAPAPVADSPKLAGKGGQQHKYIQQLIKRWAEERGYKVVVEQMILDGLGSVDVALEKASTRIACEISITTPPEHERANLQKCLAAGFGHVVAIGVESKTLERLKAEVWPELSAGQRKQVQFLTPEQVFTFLDGLEVKAPTQKAAHGEKEILTAKELEELLRIDVKTIYSYAQKGLIPYVKIQSNLRFVRSEVMAWMEKKQFQPGGRAKKE